MSHDIRSVTCKKANIFSIDSHHWISSSFGIQCCVNHFRFLTPRVYMWMLPFQTCIKFASIFPLASFCLSQSSIHVCTVQGLQDVLLTLTSVHDLLWDWKTWTPLFMFTVNQWECLEQNVKVEKYSFHSTGLLWKGGC